MTRWRQQAEGWERFDRCIFERIPRALPTIAERCCGFVCCFVLVRALHLARMSWPRVRSRVVEAEPRDVAVRDSTFRFRMSIRRSWM